MSDLRNRVHLIGNLGNDPVVKTFESGRQMARISLATNSKFTNKDGEKQEETTWHNVVVWGKLAGIAEKYLRKGREVAIEGKLAYNRYTDKEGTERMQTEIQAFELLMLGGPGKSGKN